MDLEELRKRQCITYADETRPFTFEDYTGITTDCVVSLTSRRNIYVSTVEKNWLTMRKQYDFEEGLALHFTDIRALVTYEPGALSAKAERKRQKWFKYFSSRDSTKVDPGKLHGFYTDVLSHLAAVDGHFLITGLLSSNAHLGNKEYATYALKEPIMQVFFEHLNLLVGYLTHAYLPKSRRSGLKDRHWTTKLRYDGDAALTYRGPLRMSYHQAVLQGTRQFKGDLVREVIDEIRFVSKDEVGFYQKGHPDMSHIGNEVVDFAAPFLSRKLFRDEFLDFAVQTRQVGSQAEAEAIYEDLNVIKIPGYSVIEPLTVLQDKVFSHSNLSGAIKLDPSPFRYTP